MSVCGVASIFSIITFLTQDQSYCKGVLRIYVFLTIPFASLIVSVGTRGQFQCPIRRLIIRSRKVSMVRNWYLDLLDCVEIWQFYSRAASLMSRRYNCFYESHGFRYFMRSYRMTSSGILKRTLEFSAASYWWVLCSLTGRNKAYQVELWISKQTT